MSTENISTHPTHDFKIHPSHEVDLVSHAVRNIKGGPELVKAWLDQKNGTTERLPDFRNDVGNGLKHFWS